MAKGIIYMSDQKVGTLLWWGKKGSGIIAVPIEGSQNVERYYLNQTRILQGPAIPRAGMKVRFSVIPAAPRPGQLPSAVHATFIEESASVETTSDSNPGVKS
jgi:hypothetical protein